ncbi:hypothetical protein ACR6C2_03760 [Streptomyces sp. INA 01156]
MAMGHVILREFLVDREVPYFQDYLRTFTDAPFLVTLREHGDDLVPDGFLTAADLGREDEHAENYENYENADSKTVLLDSATGEPVVPNGSLGFRWAKSGAGSWNLDLGDVVPELSLLERAGSGPRWRCPASTRAPPRAVRAWCAGAGPQDRRTPGHHRLRSDAGPVRCRAPGLPGDWPSSYDDASQPYTRPGRRRSPRCPPSRRPGSPGSSPATRSARTAVP